MPCKSQVLGNAELRARYDAHGAEALDVNFMDSAEFFTALFGSDRFDHLVGELMIAVAARSGGDFHPGQMKKLQACSPFPSLFSPSIPVSRIATSGQRLDRPVGQFCNV